MSTLVDPPETAASEPGAGDDDGRIAVVGMACRFPGAADQDQYWANLVGGVESLTVFPRAEPADHVPTAGVVADADRFDAAFFGFSPAEALILDPQHRLFLECSWEALEDAGCDPSSYPGAIGVYGGSTETGYLERLRGQRDRLPAVSDFQLRLATGLDFLTTRVAYKLGLRGPAVTVQTACSTSLVAIHLAAQALLAGECDVALAGGATVLASPEPGDYDEGGIVSRDGHCRAFDADAGGTVTGNGVGVVVLKRLAEALADGDPVRAVLLGSAVNNDAAVKVSFTAPSVEGQAQLIRAAQVVAGVDADTIGYVEAHGTATPLGDPIEVAALTKAFRQSTDRRGFCLLGSVKTNIGHADAAAGVAGFIKTVLTVEHGLIPPSLHFARPNPRLDLPTSPFAVSTTLTTWHPVDGPRRAGVSAFGIGGTNAHAILQEPPARRDEPSGPRQLLVLSARTRPALEEATTRLADHLRRHPDLPLADVAYTLQAGRQAHAHRRFLVCDSPADAVAGLSGAAGSRPATSARAVQERPVVFMFPGQGGQHIGMGRELYATEPAFAHAFDRACALAVPHLGLDLRRILHSTDGPGVAAQAAATELRRMAFGQAAVFAVEYALAQLWISWGVRPAAVVGHSLGAFAAACVAGALALPDAVRLVVERGTLLDTLPAGGMLAVPLPEAEVGPWLGDELSLAAVNGPAQSVVSGPVAAVERLGERLARAGVEARRLNIATAGHSSLVEPIAAAFESVVGSVAWLDPDVPFLSDTTGAWSGAGDLTDPTYWTAHLRRTVRFSDALATVLAEPDRVLLEVGPGRTLATLARQHPGLGASHEVVQSLPHPAEATSELTTMLTAAGRLWLSGVPIAWSGLYRGQHRNKVRLPTYAFQRERFLVEPLDRDVLPVPSAGPAPAPVTDPDHDADAAGIDGVDDAGTELERTLTGIVQQVLGVRRLTVHDNFFDLGGDSLVAAQVMAMVSATYAVNVPPSTLYEAPTVAQLAALIESRWADQLELLHP